MYCPKCSAYVPEGAEVCQNCGEPINFKNEYDNPSVNQYSYSQPTYENNNGSESSNYYNANPNNNYQSNGYNSYYSAQPNSNNYFQQAQNDFKIKDTLSTANTLGILAIVLGFLLTPLGGIICGAIGLSKVNSIPDMFNDPALTAEKKKAKRLNILGIVLPTACYILLFILIFVFVMFMGAAGAMASIG